ncbi:MAG TPA: LysE family translocator [Thioploca sp.]|nr:LysE family translocator [Thioploca sp.]
MYLQAVSLFFVMLTLALIPSSSVALVVTRSITHGVMNGISVSLGIVLGDLIFISLAIFSLSVVAETMGWLFLAIKYIGATYLIWLGYSLLTSESTTALTLEKTNQKGNLIASFFAGLFLTLGDIKAIFFYVSLFPTFVNLESLRLADVLIVILVTIFTVGGVKIFYAIIASKVGSMTEEFNLECKIKKVAGMFMVGAGSYLIIKT